MGEKEKFRGRRLFINYDETPLRGKVIYLIRQKKKVASMSTVNETIIVYLKSSDKLVFNKLFELYEWDSALFDDCFNQRFRS